MRWMSVRIICIMGRSGSGKSSIRDSLSRMGYYRLISYTTRGPEDGEVHGRDYHFVNKNEFIGLLHKDIIMEWTEYNGSFYGAPHPIGSMNNVVIMEPEGYRTIKERYGKQVIGVYVEVPTDLVGARSEEMVGRQGKELETGIEERRITDNIRFKGIEKEVELVVDGTKDITTVTAEILKYISENKL